MGKVGIDMFSFHDWNYLITVDYLSNYFEIDKVPSKKMSDVIYCLKAQFARHGAFATAEFRDFVTKYDFEQTFSSPRFPSSNGKSENAIKTAKRSPR